MAYAWLARYGWPRAVAASCLVFAAVTAVLGTIPLVLPLALPLVLIGLVAALRLMPGHDRSTSAVIGPPPAWDLPARMIVATTFVVLLTAGAPVLGPQLTGLLAPFPLYAAILAIFAHQQAGAQAAARVLHGLLLGLFAFVGFFATLAALLGRFGVAPAFAAALAATLLIQAGSLWMLRRLANTAPRTY